MTAPFFVLLAKVWCIFAGQSCHQSVALCPLGLCEPHLLVRPLAGARRIGGCPLESGVTNQLADLDNSFYLCVVT